VVEGGLRGVRSYFLDNTLVCDSLCVYQLFKPFLFTFLGKSFDVLLPGLKIFSCISFVASCIVIVGLFFFLTLA